MARATLWLKGGSFDSISRYAQALTPSRSLRLRRIKPLDSARD